MTMSQTSLNGEHYPSGSWSTNMNSSNADVNRERSLSRSPAPRVSSRPSHQRRGHYSRSPERGNRSYSRSRSVSRSPPPYDRYRPAHSYGRSRREDYSPPPKYSRRSRSPYESSRRYRRHSRSPSPRDNGYGGGRSRPSQIGYSSHRGSSPRRSVRYDREGRATTTSIFVGNIPYHYKEEHLRDMFEKYGKIVHIAIPQDHKVKHNKGICFIEFSERRDAEEAMRATTGVRIDGRSLRLDWDPGAARKNIRVSQASSSGRVQDSDGGNYYGDRDRRSRSRSLSPRSYSPPRR